MIWQSFGFICQKLSEFTVLQQQKDRFVQQILHRENKLQAFTRTIVAYKCNDVQSVNLHHHVYHE